MRSSTMKFSHLILFLILVIPLSLNAQNNKIDDEESPIQTITENDIEEEIIRNLDLLKNLNLVENLREFEEISEMMDYEEDE